MLRTQQKIDLSDMIRHGLLSWLTAVMVEYLRLSSAMRSLEGLQSMAEMSFFRVLVLTACGTAVWTAVSLRRNMVQPERWAIAGIFGVLAAVSIAAGAGWVYVGICVAVAAGLAVYAKQGWNGAPLRKMPEYPARRCCIWITAGLAVLFFLFVSVWTVFRVLSFSTPSYDFGLFSQMFYYMKETGFPMTTLERDGLLSHFHVHMSPIYYLMLPFYMLAPHPAVLQILQAAVLASAVIPLWKIGRIHGLTDWQRMLLCGILLLFPAFSGGTSYDLHENCFLTPLILWLFYGIDRKSAGITGAAAVLTLLVKEDAAVYVAVIGLWVTVSAALHHRKGENRSLYAGMMLLSGAVGWFLLVTGFLANIGDGVMTYRYENFIYDGSASLMTVIKAVLMNPMKALYECADPDKLRFLILTMVPLLGLPLLTRRYERYLLLIPYILVNLMSDYRYQYDLFFQYSFGSTACLMYLTAVNLADFRGELRRMTALASAVVVSGACFCAVIVPKAEVYPQKYRDHAASYGEIREKLSQIPEESAVAASTFYTTELSGRRILYDVKYCSEEHLLDCDYVVLSESEKDRRNLEELLHRESYEAADRIAGVLTIYQKSAP